MTPTAISSVKLSHRRGRMLVFLAAAISLTMGRSTCLQADTVNLVQVTGQNGTLTSNAQDAQANANASVPNNTAIATAGSGGIFPPQTNSNLGGINGGKEQVRNNFPI